MATKLDKTLKRELTVKGQSYTLAISPEGLKLTAKGHRRGLELQWEALISGDAALVAALNASVAQPPGEPDTRAAGETATTRKDVT